MTESHSNHAAEALLDDRLRRLMRPPPEQHLAEIAHRAIRQACPDAVTRHLRIPPRRLAIAAALTGAVLGTWLIGQVLGPAQQPTPAYQLQPQRSMHTVYLDTVAEGFLPLWVCADDREFAQTFRAVHYQGLVLGELPPGTTALGLAYSNSLTPRTTCVLAAVGDERVMVFVDRIERDRPQTAPEGMHLHRRQIDRLVLYELSPLEEPALLPWFRNPDGDH